MTGRLYLCWEDGHRFLNQLLPSFQNLHFTEPSRSFRFFFILAHWFSIRLKLAYENKAAQKPFRELCLGIIEWHLDFGLYDLFIESEKIKFMWDTTGDSCFKDDRVSQWESFLHQNTQRLYSLTAIKVQIMPGPF